MNNIKESSKLIDRYKKRESSFDLNEYYSPIGVGNILVSQERDRAYAEILREHFKNHSPKSIRVLEIGCGYGHNLQALIRLGVHPKNIVAVELIPERVELAKSLLPQDTHIFEGDALSYDFQNNEFDIVLLSTVFSSILCQDTKTKLAQKCLSLLAPKGGILFYDFFWTRKGSDYIKPISIKEIKSLFKGTLVYKKRITLYYSLAFRLGQISPILTGVLNKISFLKTHWIVLIKNNSK